MTIITLFIYSFFFFLFLLFFKLIQGNKFIKYGRQGKPHLKLVQITSNEDRVAWRSPKKEKSKISYIMFSEVYKEYKYI